MSAVTVPQDAKEMARAQSIAATKARDKTFLNISMFLLNFWFVIDVVTNLILFIKA
jgi:hypothetical protein